MAILTCPFEPPKSGAQWTGVLAAPCKGGPWYPWLAQEQFLNGPPLEVAGCFFFLSHELRGRRRR